ncbi:major capsid protein P2 [Shewanella submarina]|uniref:Major capsid protein P2 n=1 Tax=Shewanella submarina TaxID=2016376 RepID=A0ABV7GG09_9GAMM|nr:major capsid protein P2 [Shewanella submarina]MCL1038033.1 major capsid protein P2 [Shewanella submarina]
MARNFVKLPSWSNVAAGNTATLELPLGRTYDKIHIRYSGLSLAQMKHIRVNINGRAIEEFKHGQSLQDENKYYLRNVAANVLDIHFKRDEMKTLGEARAFGLGTSSQPYPDPGTGEMVNPPVIANVTLEIDIDEAAVNPTLEAYAIQSNPAPIGFITKVKNFPVALNPGINEVDNIPRPNTARIGSLHILTEQTIEKIEVELDSAKIYELPTSLAEKIQVDHGRSPQANRYTVDFCLEGDMLQALPMIGSQDFRVRLFAADDTPVSSSATVVVHYFDGLAGI